MGFVGAMKQFFGMKQGQTLTEFSKELKELTKEDRAEFHQMLVEQAGIVCDPPLEK